MLGALLSVFAASLPLTWTPPTHNTDGSPLTDLEAYGVYWDCGSGEQSDLILAPANGYTVENLPDEGVCEFTATAINEAGIESVRSGALVHEFVDGPADPTVGPNITWTESVVAVEIVGTVQQPAYGGEQNPNAINVTVDAEATAAYAHGDYYSSTAGTGVASITLGGNAPDQFIEINNNGGDFNAAWIAAWYNPPTGTQALDPAWDADPSFGPQVVFYTTKGGNTTSWRDVDLVAGDVDDQLAFTLTTVSGDLVVKFDTKTSTGGTPGNTSGWTSLLTTAFTDQEVGRLASIVATGTTQAVSSENERYSQLTAVAIPPASGSTEFEQDVSGAVTPAGAITKRAQKPLAGAVTPTSTVEASSVFTTSVSGSLTPAGSLVKRANKVLAGLMASAGTIVRDVQKVLAGAVTPTSALNKRTTKSFSGSVEPTGETTPATVFTTAVDGAITPTGAISKETQKQVAGSVTPASALTKETDKQLAGGVTPEGDLTAAQVFTQSVAGALGLAGALATQLIEGAGEAVRRAYRRMTTLLGTLLHGRR